MTQEGVQSSYFAHLESIVEQRLLHVTWGVNSYTTQDPKVILVQCKEGLRCAKVIQPIDKLLSSGN